MAATVGFALAAVITLGYSAVSSASSATPSVLSFTPRFQVLEDNTPAADTEVADATEGAESADAAAEEAVDGRTDEEKGRGEGGQWDNTDVGRGLGGKWDINAQEHKVLAPDYATKYGMAAAVSSQRMFNQIGVARDGTPVTEAQARSIASRYGMVPVSLAKPPAVVRTAVQMIPRPTTYATVPAPVSYSSVSYATVPTPAQPAGPPPGYKIVAGPPQISMQAVSGVPNVVTTTPGFTAVSRMRPWVGLTAQQAADQGEAASEGAQGTTNAVTTEEPPAADETPAEEPEEGEEGGEEEPTEEPTEESTEEPAEEPAEGPAADEEPAESSAPEEPPTDEAAPAETSKDAPSIQNTAAAWGIPLLSGANVVGQPVAYSGPQMVTSPYVMPPLERKAEGASKPSVMPMGVPAVVAGASRLIPSPGSSVFRFATGQPASAESAGPMASAKMVVTSSGGVGSEFMAKQGQVVGSGLTANKGAGEGLDVSAGQGDAKGTGLNIGSGQEAGYGLSAVSGSAAGDGVSVAKGVAQGRGITVHQGSVAGEGILIGDDGSGHGEFIGSGSGSGTDITVSKGTAVGEGISMAEGQASGDGLTVNAGSAKGSGLAGRQGSGQGQGLSVGSGSVRGTDVKVVQGSVAGEGIYVQHGSLVSPV